MQEATHEKKGKKFDVLKIKILKRILNHRAFQYAIILPNLLVFWLVILAAFFGTPVGNMNISIVLIWILWWFALIGLMVPLLSRVWCTICPIPVFGDWFQRRDMIRKSGEKVPRFTGLNRKWPKKLDNIWIQNIGFLTVATFSAIMVTRPVVTGILLSSLFIIGTVMALIWKGRAFCRYVCPVGGFLGLFSMTATVEIRPIDDATCQHHVDKECLKGGENSYGCPWLIYPGGLKRNNFCGLCFECIKACPYDNLALNVREFGSDLTVKSGKAVDEAFKTFIMLTLAPLYIIVMQGPWGWIRNMANVFWVPPFGWAVTGLEGFAVYTGIFFIGTLVFTPSIFLFFTWISKILVKSKDITLKKLFIHSSYELIPLALMAWIGFSIPLLLTSWTYIVNVMMDPFGLGWDPLGIGYIAWSPLIPEFIPYMQLITVIVGIYYSIKVGYKISTQLFEDKSKALTYFVPHLIFILLISSFFVWLFLG